MFTSSTAERSPFSYEEKALTRRKVSEIAHNERHTFCFRLFSISVRTLREGERVCSSSTATAVPLPLEGKDLTRSIWERDFEYRALLLTIDY